MCVPRGASYGGALPRRRPETEDAMPRYLVERSFPRGLAIPVDRIAEVRVLDPYFYTSP